MWLSAAKELTTSALTQNIPLTSLVRQFAAATDTVQRETAGPFGEKIPWTVIMNSIANTIPGG